MAHYLQSFIADGFADDCDELIHQCLKETPVTYKSFTKVFRNMQISSIFQDRQSGAEIAELSEEAINIAKYYMVADTEVFEETVVGLFLVYALIKLQPFEDFAYLRLVDNDVPYIERMEQVARRDKRLDILYVLGRLLTENTRFLAASRERGMEPSYKKYLEGCPSIDNLGMRPKGVFLRQNEELDIIKELKGLQQQYDDAKMKVKVTDLKYTNSKFAAELDSSLKNIISGIIHEESGLDEDADDIQESVRSIKDRAMKNKVNPMKHLIGVEDRSPTKSTAPSTSNLKSPPGKLLSSPVKKIPNKKRKPPPKRQKRKRESSESSIKSDTSVELSDHDSDSIDIDLSSFDKAKANTESATEEINADTEVSELPELQVDSKNIQFRSLPCVITSENNGKVFEIEIIDKLKESTNRLSSATGRKQFAIEAENALNNKTRKEKRDLKKTILKSRFKRMGLDPVANFKPAE